MITLFQTTTATKTEGKYFLPKNSYHNEYKKTSSCGNDNISVRILKDFSDKLSTHTC